MKLSKEERDRRANYISSLMQSGKTNQEARKIADHKRKQKNNTSSSNERPFFSPSGDEWNDYAWSGDDF